MRRFVHRHGLLLIVVPVAVAIAAAGAAYAAGGGGKITVCVHKKGGALYSAKKCSKHDSKLTWNVQGPAGSNGRNGANGANGAPGQNGAVAGYSASHYSVQDITSATQSSPQTILTKQLPAGSFIVNAKTTLSASSTTSTGYVNDQCNLTDGANVDTAQWSSPFHALILSTYGANGTVSMDLALSTQSPTTVTLSCYPVATNGSGFSTGAAYSVLTAVQTSSNQ
jgi:hypothetical protein